MQISIPPVIPPETTTTTSGNNVRSCRVKQGLGYKPAMIPLRALFLDGAEVVADES